ncbi:MAG TPA: DoxX family protein [Myxococcales bacterium]|jgi:putative oxidoreductase|nr:DoxX family protein [Myxococcales bacterium]
MGTTRAEVGWLVVRVTFGLALAYFHGYAKVFLGGASGLVATVGNLGFPAPLFFAWCASLAEFAGALLVAMGLATRYAAAAVTVTLAVALYSQRNDAIHHMELAVLYLAPMAAAVLIGGGRYSLDQWIRLRWPIERRG